LGDHFSASSITATVIYRETDGNETELAPMTSLSQTGPTYATLHSALFQAVLPARKTTGKLYLRFLMPPSDTYDNSGISRDILVVPVANGMPLMRFRTQSGGQHMLTANDNERISMTNNSWVHEANLGFVKTKPETGFAPLYRFFRSNNNDHYFSLSSSTPSGYVAEGITGYVYSTSVTGSKPIYSYSAYSGDNRVYTSNYNELGGGDGYWRYEGIAFYVIE
jgi:hypothetical protein